MKILCNEAVRPEILFGVSEHASFSVVRKLAVFWENPAGFCRTHHYLFRYRR